jgi:hypothetical protein
MPIQSLTDPVLGEMIKLQKPLYSMLPELRELDFLSSIDDGVTTTTTATKSNAAAGRETTPTRVKRDKVDTLRECMREYHDEMGRIVHISDTIARKRLEDVRRVDVRKLAAQLKGLRAQAAESTTDA